MGLSNSSQIRVGQPVYRQQSNAESVSGPNVVRQSSIRQSLARQYTADMRKAYPEVALAERELKGIDERSLFEVILDVVWTLGSCLSSFVISESIEEPPTDVLVNPQRVLRRKVSYSDYQRVMGWQPYALSGKANEISGRVNLARMLLDEETLILKKLEAMGSWDDLKEVFSVRHRWNDTLPGELSMTALRKSIRGRKAEPLVKCSLTDLSVSDIHRFESKETEQVGRLRSLKLH